MASDVVGVLDALDEPGGTIMVADRGALFGFRAALDHPERVARLAVIGIIPTLDLWAAMGGTAGIFAAGLLLPRPARRPR